MKRNQLTEQQIQTILSLFRQALEHGPWSGSPLLRVLGKKLQAIYDTFEAKVALGEAEDQDKKSLTVRQQQPLDTEEMVFISLYSSDGAHLKSWEQILLNLPRQLITRPIYEKEEDVKRAIRSREKQINEAYIVAYVSKQDILPIPQDKAPKDRLGTFLLTLKEKCLSPEKIIRLVHQSGVYTYDRGRLNKETATPSHR